jgi:hypothetical protein
VLIDHLSAKRKYNDPHRPKTRKSAETQGFSFQPVNRQHRSRQGFQKRRNLDGFLPFGEGYFINESFGDVVTLYPPAACGGL